MPNLVAARRSGRKGGGGAVQADRQTDRHRQTERQTDRETDRQTDRQAGRQTDRQTDRQKGTLQLYIDAHIKCLNNVTNRELDKLNTWFIINKLPLKVSKTNDIIFGNCKTAFGPDIIIHNDQITRVNQKKFLEVWID